MPRCTVFTAPFEMPRSFLVCGENPCHVICVHASHFGKFHLSQMSRLSMSVVSDENGTAAGAGELHNNALLEPIILVQV